MIILAEKEAPFDPDEPRDKSGQWVKKGSGDAKKSRATKTPSLKPARSRAALPAHIKALKLPPAWTDVRYAEDPDDDLQAVGKDAKGRLQYVYSKSFVDKKAAEKFERINALDDKMREIDMQVTEALKKKSEEAACLRLIMLTGIRPGSDKDTQAARQAFGATTLRGQHVVVRGSKVSLRFVGKKGVDLDIPVADPRLARELIRRKTAAGKNGKLFATRSCRASHTRSTAEGSRRRTCGPTSAQRWRRTSSRRDPFLGPRRSTGPRCETSRGS